MVTPVNHQWYRINTNKITDNHNIAICNDTTINMVLLPPAEQLEFNTLKTIARLSPLQQMNTETTSPSEKLATPNNTIYKNESQPLTAKK